ncbi:MAG: ferritin [Eubacteriales bacterium]|nr:ferritin [Eubacteriales bacterium]
MISKNMETALNEQINREYESAYIYKAMAQYFAQKNLNGFRHFFAEQAKEELEHGQKMIDYMNEQGANVVLTAIATPKADYDNTIEVFETALKHEKMVTGHINKLMRLAKDEHDYATEIFLGWFVTEQVEEEDSFTSLVDLLKFLDGDRASIYLLDQKLGSRA